MASIRNEISIKSSADDVWKVIGDFGTGPSRMAPGYVVDTRIDGDCRVVTFADGTVARERFISVDGDARRIVYTVIGDTLCPNHDNASMQVVAEDQHHCRLIWIHDVLPDDLAVPIQTAMAQGAAVIKRTLESRAGRA
ncbi:SRPBCC family protein [Micromonospora eburnea]|uniref:Polyketide cyclase / dehydrase and lipid transport n=1 Tax=Micromonospora eburnea TaxID=227316 RepID=A0A1C6U8G1_9ACTN|nr:SRPBCC family protein [Micromonospora eburnea]SCL50248.1 Polyketide cyclase / dehydrase and lipid transport [Micromonospora eburnea]